MKKILVTVLIIVLTLSLTACGGKTSNDDLTTNSVVEQTDTVSNETVSAEAPTEEKVYKYKAYGLQNVSEVPEPYYSEEYNCYYVRFAKACCPKCNGDVSIEPKISSKDVGKDTVIWEGSACCGNTHEDAFFNGWFDVAVQFVKVEE